MLAAPGELLEELFAAHQNRWTHADELAALALEKLDELSIMFGQAWGDPKQRPRKTPKPYRYTRPNQPPAKRSTIAEIRAFFRGR